MMGPLKVERTQRIVGWTVRAMLGAGTGGGGFSLGAKMAPHVSIQKAETKQAKLSMHTVL